MINKRKKSWIAGAVFLFWTSFSVAYNGGGMRPLNEDQMRSVTGQGLIVSDKISGTTLANPNAYSSPFEFYRIGLDGELQLNLNVSKLQLGCGGINDHLSGHAGCDIDIDYLSLMGRNGTDIGDPGSPFKLDRPYIEFAVKNDNSTTLREIAGIKIGAQSADGAISAGRRYYSNNAVNQENTAFATTCNTGSVTGAGVVGCHSGLNTVSGFLGTDLSLTMRVKASVIGLVNLDAWGCTGRTTSTDDLCGTNQSDSVFVDLAGTRMQSLGLRAAGLTLTGGGAVALLEGLGLNDVYAQLNADARTVHGLAFENTGDFFLSFQREPVAYPRYSKLSPTEEFTQDGMMGVALDACATTNQATPRCSSGYAVPANTGWWMNAPSAKLVDVYNDNMELGTLSIGDAISLLGAPGFPIVNPELNFHRAQNCYGSSSFC